MKKNILTICVIVSAILWGVFWFFFQKPSLQTSQENYVTNLNPLEFEAILNKSDVFILDVHTPEQQHLAGTDAFIPYNKLVENTTQLPADKNTPIAVYCRSGSMSREASETLVSLGYTQIYDLIGGLDAYRENHVSVQFSPTEQDLGTVIYGEVTTTEFVLTNFTPTTLTINRLSTSCGCTKATAEKTILEPYESVAVTVTFDPAVHQDDTDLGEITRTIYIDTDNPNFDHLTATIKAVVVKK